MKKALLLLILISATATFAQAQKIAYVNTQTIMEGYSGAIAAQAKIDELLTNITAKRDSMAQALQTAYDNYQQQQGTMTDEIKAQTEQKIVRLDQELKQFEQAKLSQPNGEIYVENARIMGPVREKVRNAINAVAVEKGFSFIFDKSSEVVLLFADEAFNITSEVLLKLKSTK